MPLYKPQLQYWVQDSSRILSWKSLQLKTDEDPTPDPGAAGIVLSVSGGHSPQIFLVGTEKNTDFWAIDCQLCQISMQVISYRIHGLVYLPIHEWFILMGSM